MANLEELADQIGEQFQKRSGRLYRASLVVKVLFVFGGSATGAISALEGWNVVGITSAIVVMSGAALNAFVEQDASQQLELARRCLEEARKLEQRLKDLVEFRTASDRVNELKARLEQDPIASKSDELRR